MPHPDLIAHHEQTRRDVVLLAPGIWTAVGYAASNVHMIEGRDTVTIIDTSESTAAAQDILQAFREHCGKPIGRIIYTHGHRDHISGASEFSDGTIPILASGGFESDLIDTGGTSASGSASDSVNIRPSIALGRRTQAQFGFGLADSERISLGCGPGDRPLKGLGAGFLPPTVLIHEEQDVDLDGVSAQLLFAPGETADHMVVWLPDTRVLFCGDNWYHAFPNLYAIRGTPYRDFAAWAASLAKLAALQAEVLAPGHLRPVSGAERVHEVLSTTRAAIVHVMRATAQGMNAGLSHDDIAATMHLPDELADKPWLAGLYGKPEWSARAYAVGTLGWYDGNPTHLGTLSSRARAEHVAALAGGIANLHEQAKAATDRQWQLELCDHLLALNEPAEVLKAGALEQLAELEINATARNTYLWEARRLRDLADP